MAWLTKSVRHEFSGAGRVAQAVPSRGKRQGAAAAHLGFYGCSAHPQILGGIPLVHVEDTLQDPSADGLQSIKGGLWERQQSHGPQPLQA